MQPACSVEVEDAVECAGVAVKEILIVLKILVNVDPGLVNVDPNLVEMLTCSEYASQRSSMAWWETAQPSFPSRDRGCFSSILHMTS